MSFSSFYRLKPFQIKSDVRQERCVNCGPLISPERPCCMEVRRAAIGLEDAKSKVGIEVLDITYITYNKLMCSSPVS